MRAAWIVALLVACGGSPPPEKLPHVRRYPKPEPVAEPQPPRSRDTGDLWADLGIDGSNWRTKLAAIPDALRAPMAVQFLQQGNLTCPAQPLPADGCASQAVLREITPDSTIYDPCLRRRIAMWALDQIRSDELASTLTDELVAMVRIPPPERELGAAALRKIPAGLETASALWEAKEAGNHELVSKFSVDGFDPADLRMAAREYHLDAAVLALDPAGALELYGDAIGDRYLLPATRFAAIDDLVELAERTTDPEERDEIARELEAATDTSNCAIAAAARGALARIGGGDVPLPTGPFRTEEEVVAAVCAAVGSGARGKAWKTIVSRHDLEIISSKDDPFRVDALWAKYPFAYDDDLNGAPDVPEADPDGDGDASTTSEVSTRAWSNRFTLPFADELALALPHCDGTICEVPDSSVWFELVIRKERGTKLRLRGIERHERVGSDC